VATINDFRENHENYGLKWRNCPIRQTNNGDKALTFYNRLWLWLDAIVSVGGGAATRKGCWDGVRGCKISVRQPGYLRKKVNTKVFIYRVDQSLFFCSAL